MVEYKNFFSNFITNRLTIGVRFKSIPHYDIEVNVMLIYRFLKNDSTEFKIVAYEDFEDKEYGVFIKKGTVFCTNTFDNAKFIEFIKEKVLFSNFSMQYSSTAIGQAYTILEEIMNEDGLDNGLIKYDNPNEIPKEIHK